MTDVLPWLAFAGCLLCLWGCRRSVARVLGLERLHAAYVGRSVRGAGSEPVEHAAQQARKQ